MEHVNAKERKVVILTYYSVKFADETEAMLYIVKRHCYDSILTANGQGRSEFRNTFEIHLPFSLCEENTMRLLIEERP